MLSALAVVQPACAAGRAKPAAKAVRAPEAMEPGDLNQVVQGLAGFESRASKYNKDDWNFVLGYANFVGGQWAAAEHYLGLADGKLAAAQDHILYFMAAADNRMGKFSDALALLDRFDAIGRDSVWSNEALVERGIALSGSGRYSESASSLSRALGAANASDKPRIDRELARTYIASGDGERAASYIRNMAISCAGERELSQLNDLFDALKSRYHIDVRAWIEEPQQQLRLIQSYVAASQWADAAVRLEKLVKHGSLNGSDLVRAKWMLARCYRWTHRYDEAIAIMETLRRDPSSGSFSDDLLGTLATTYMKKNDYAKALSIRQGMLDRMPPASRGAAQMAYKIAFLHMDEGRYAEAIPLWERAASMRGAGHQAVMARWYIGWCNYMQGDYAAAARDFDALFKSGAKAADIDDRVEYWKARSLVHIKQKEEAMAVFRKIVQEHPGGYYAELAGRALAGDLRNTQDFAAARDAWPAGSALEPRIPAEGRGHLGAAALFDRLGLHDEAAMEVRAAARDGDGSPEEIISLAKRNYVHDTAYVIAKVRYKYVLDDSPGHDASSRFIWQAAYPEAYKPAVESLASREGIDPMLAWSIMQNESAFKPAVVSPAGAVGLMQLMPTTAGKISKERGGSGDPSMEDLTRPAENISYGVAYLGKLSRLFPGNSAAVIASYNAGEEAVARWLSNGSFTDIEQWIEEIPYDETNLYVKKVMTSYWKYQRLYGRES